MPDPQSPVDGMSAEVKTLQLRFDVPLRSTATMTRSARKIAFVTASTDHGMMIFNRFDQHLVREGLGYGMGYQLLETSSYDQSEVDLLVTLLDVRRRIYGDGVIAVDCGANIGVHTIEWARHMATWGVVVAFEAQERIYYALAGNIAINNCFNARAIHAAVTTKPGVMKMPSPNYCIASSFGSLELKYRDGVEFIGQHIDYSENKMITVQATCLDAFKFPRLDVLKIDIEGMELDALEGGQHCINQLRPIIVVESNKSDAEKLRDWLESRGYWILPVGINFLAVHTEDRCLPLIQPQKNPSIESKAW